MLRYRLRIWEESLRSAVAIFARAAAEGVAPTDPFTNSPATANSVERSAPLLVVPVADWAGLVPVLPDELGFLPDFDEPGFVAFATAALTFALS